MFLSTALRTIESAVLDLQKVGCKPVLQVLVLPSGRWSASLVDPGADPHVECEGSTSEQAILRLARHLETEIL